jgi:hypothetical protein
MGYRYRYTIDGKPAKVCPKCSENWQVHYGLVVELIDHGVRRRFQSQLDADGVLQDNESGSIWQGLHSSTLCCICWTQLCDVADEENLGRQRGVEPPLDILDGPNRDKVVGETTPVMCDECGETIQERDGGTLENRYHKASCSLYDPEKE